MDDLLDSWIKSSVMSLHVYSKVRFDNAKDTKELIDVANECSKSLVDAVRYKVHDNIEALLNEKIQDSVNEGRLIVRIGNKFYEVKEVE